MKKITEKPLITIKNNRSSCPVSTSLEIVGDQWSLILIRDLFMQRNTFSDFKNSPEKISTNILTDRINKLLKYELIDYTIHPKNRKIKLYYLTQSGINLYPLLYDLSMWSKDHLGMEFHPLSIEWYKNSEKEEREVFIKRTIEEYKEFRASLLNKEKLPV
jgi:DNA-binding HxlR family transcriptional regulator